MHRISGRIIRLFFYISSIQPHVGFGLPNIRPIGTRNHTVRIHKFATKNIPKTLLLLHAWKESAPVKVKKTKLTFNSLLFFSISDDIQMFGQKSGRVSGF
jgi:hypothetical protein